jgi:hypothetical protein
MVVIAHQTPGIQQPTLLLHLLGEALNEAEAILSSRNIACCALPRAVTW